MTVEQYTKFTENPILALLLVLAVVWSIIWKGIALWKSGRNGQKGWFIVLLIVNTVGILEIIYLLCCSKKKQSQPSINSAQ